MREMCPLRLILIFLSATLAGFIVIRNLKSQQQLPDTDENTNNNSMTQQSSSATFISKVRLAMESGLWTFVDMASGKYLWRHLGSSSKRSL